ncbi:MAG: electron transfer flavoprotein subunit beta/FixA family protein [Saprospiraceae bacterium]|nr:electron transfer flavoprotein subunit beta/FixA family protein [Saprospiraceae bacterium]
MKILVCISKTPDTTSKIAFDSSNKKFVEDGVQFIMNPYDEWYALVRGLELKEQLGGQVDVIHVGDQNSESIIRKALAIGADAAIRIDHTPVDSFDTASQIAEIAKSRGYDLIFLGKETLDHNGSEVGGLVAGLLDWPYIAYASKLTQQNDTAIIESELEGGVRVIECKVPFVMSCAKGIAEQRIPNMMGIMNSKKKPLEVISPIASEAKIEIEKFELPSGKASVKMLSPDNIDELVDVFKNELKIL